MSCSQGWKSKGSVAPQFKREPSHFLLTHEFKMVLGD
uniref:Uncharacterized protein n=1 Tax=Arundo donax TaxID=35708 RepID=A0A0A8ZM04_ARUDO